MISYILYTIMRMDDDPDNYFPFYILGIVVGVFWPLSLIAFLFYGLNWIISKQIEKFLNKDKRHDQW